MRFSITILLVAAQLPAQAAADPDPARRFFAAAPVVRIEITLDSASRDRLRQRPREYVPATVRVDGRKRAWSNVGIKLKGAAGSFREVDDRPGLTVNLGKFGEPHRLHGLRRFHLNNGVQDETRLCEWLGSELFTAAGYPAPRVAHALVWLDDRPLGLYVLREGFDEQFLARCFGTDAGNLYDGGFCRDIDRSLEKDAGAGPDDGSDLRRLRAACEGAELATRLERALDIAAFIDFMALEAMVGHWDGYSQNRNNFRLWCTTAPGQSRFLPHGMDQLFGDAEASVLEFPSAIAANAVHQQPGWRELYRARLADLLPLFRSAPLVRQIKRRAAQLERALKTVDRDLAASHKRAVGRLIGKVEDRYRSLKKQVKAPEPEPLAFRGEQAVRLKTWRPAGETEGIELKKRSYRGAPALQIACSARGGEERRGSYRTSVMLARGKYRLLAAVRCADVVALPDQGGRPRGGARLVVDGAQSGRLIGDSAWTDLVCEFDVTDYRRTVELRLELRALDGKAWFRRDSLRLQRIDPR